jgi:hypothetical protein
MKTENTSTLRDLSERICRYFKFPHGTKIALLDKRKRRYVRDDRRFAHKPVVKRNFTGWPDPSVRVGSFCENYVAPLFETELEPLGLELEVIGADGKGCHGNMSLKNVCEIDPTMTEEEITELEKIDAEVERLKKPIQKQIMELKRSASYPDESVCRAYIESLAEIFGHKQYLEALDSVF